MRKLVLFTVSFTAAAAAYIWLLPRIAVLFLAVAFAVCAAGLLFLQTDNGKRIRILALGAAIGFLWSWAYEQWVIAPRRELCGDRISISATITQTPQETKYGCRACAKLDEGSIMLYLNCEPEELELGDKVSLDAEIVDASSNAEGEENLYFQSKGISLLGFQKGEMQTERPNKLPISCIPAAVTEFTRNRVREIFPSDAAPFANALLTGDTTELSYRDSNNLSLTGIRHIIAVSGIHVSLIVGIFMFLFRQRRMLATLFCIPTIFLFAAMLGFSPSITRSVIMNSVLLLAPLFRRENDAPTSLAVALLTILLVNPWAIASVSLQLSFGAMVGLFLFTPKIYEWALGKKQVKQKKKSVLYRVRQVASLSFAATVGVSVVTTPLVAYYFGTVSLISPLTNILTLGVLSLCFTLSFCSVLLSLILPLGKIAAWLIAWPIRAVLWLVSQFARMPYSAVFTDSVFVVAWLVVAYLLIGAFIAIKRERRPLALIGGLAFTLIISIFLSSYTTKRPSFTAFDVGQGQCLLLRTDSRTIMIDCGGDRDDASGEIVVRKLLMAGDWELDALVLTHYDEDHVCGAEQLMYRIPVKHLFIPNLPDEEGKRYILQLADSYDVPVTIVTENTQLQFSGGYIALYPPIDNSGKNACMAALLSVDECDILVTGDMDIASEERIVTRYDLPKLEVLIAGHHGSKYATGETLLQVTRPEVVCICVGKNSYGHPTWEVLERIRSIGATVYRTDKNGDIVISR